MLIALLTAGSLSTQIDIDTHRGSLTSYPSSLRPAHWQGPTDSSDRR
ncbi:hypothetical protein [Nocardia flavorosea]|nr:hypothetical protein [Nocardia flavorosea]